MIKIKATEIHVPFGDTIFKHVTKSEIVTRFKGVLGSYNPYTFMIHAKPPMMKTNDNYQIEIDDFFRFFDINLKKYDTIDQKLIFLLKNTAWYHEIRHFNDCICSPMGYGIFGRDWYYYTEIFKTLIEIRNSGSIIEFPIFDKVIIPTIKGENVSKIYLDIYNKFSSLLISRVLVNGDLDLLEVDASFADYELIWLTLTEGPIESLKIPCFPTRTSIDGIEKCILIPMGFRAITEENTRIVQEMILRSYGQDIVDAYRSRLDDLSEYKVINKFFTKIMKNRGVDIKDKFVGEKLMNELYKLLFHGLHTSMYHDLASSESYPMNRIIDYFERYFSIDDITLHADLGSVNKSLLDFKKELLYDMPTKKDDFFFNSIHDYVVDYCVLPSINLYLSEEFNSYYKPDSPDWYLVFGSKLPQPLLSIQGNHLGYNYLERDYIFNKHLMIITGWVFFMSTVEQLFGSDHIQCPVLHIEYKDCFNDPVMHPNSNCETALLNGGCGSLKSGENLIGHPDCLWKKVMIEWGIVKA